jgi:hypothetical protein
VRLGDYPLASLEPDIARELLYAYIDDIESIRAQYGGTAHLVDESFIGGSGLPEGTLVPKPAAYFSRFYDGRESYKPYIKAACKLRTTSGECATSSGTLDPAGFWPKPERDTLDETIARLRRYIELGIKAPVSTLMPTAVGRGWIVAAASAAATGTALLVAGLIRASRRR